MEAVFLKLLNMSITASWLVLAVILLRLLLKKAPKGMVCLLWGLVAIRLICPVSLESVWSLVPSVETVPEDIGSMEEPEVDFGVEMLDEVVNPILQENFVPEVEQPVQMPEMENPTDIPQVEQPAAPIQPEQPFEEPMVKETKTPLEIVTIAATSLWVVGIAAMVFYTVFSYARILRRVRVSVPFEKNIRVCDTIDMPFILGVFRSEIYLPSTLKEEQVGYVLLHEQAHLKRKDHIWKPLAFALLTVYWFNPILWVAYHLFSRDVEMACDERVIRDMNLEQKKAYTQTLLLCSVSGSHVPVCPLAFGEVGVKRRVKSMKNYKKPPMWLTVAAVAAVLLAAIFFLTDPKEEGVPVDLEIEAFVSQMREYWHIPYLTFEEHTILEIEETEEETILYMMAYDEWYTIDENYQLELVGSSHQPMVVSLVYDPLSDWSMNDQWFPEQGENYEKSIQEKFPEYLWKKLDPADYEKKHQEKCKEKKDAWQAERDEIERWNATMAGADEIQKLGFGYKVANVQGTSIYDVATDSSNAVMFSETGNSVTHFPVFQMESQEDLQQFRQKYASVMKFTDGLRMTPSYDEVVEKYDEAYFEENTLFLVYRDVQAGVDMEVTSVECAMTENGKQIWIYVDDTEENSSQSLYYCWLAFVEVKKADAEDAAMITAVKDEERLPKADPVNEWESVLNNLDTFVEKEIVGIQRYDGGGTNYAFTAHTILGTEVKEESLTVYGVVYSEDYALELEQGTWEYVWVHRRSEHEPVAITFEKSEEGGVKCAEYWRPEDGNQYEASIKEKFPEDLWNQTDTNDYAEQHQAVCREKLEAFLKDWDEIHSWDKAMDASIPQSLDFSYEMVNLEYSSGEQSFRESASNKELLPSRLLEHCPVQVIQSRKELEDFREKYQGEMRFTRRYKDYPIYDDVEGKYDAAYFEKNALILVYINCLSDDRMDVASVESARTEKGNQIRVHVTKTGSPLVGTSVEGTNWLLMVEVEKDDIEDAAMISAVRGELDYIEVQPVDVSSSISVSENLGAFQVWMEVGHADDEKIILKNGFGLYVLEKQGKEYVLTSSVSYDTIAGAWRHGSGFDDAAKEALTYASHFYEADSVLIKPMHLRSERDMTGAYVYEYGYGDEVVKKEWVSWEEYDALFYESESSDEGLVTKIDQILKPRNYSVWGTLTYTEAKDCVGFLVFDYSAVGTIGYQKYGTYDLTTGEVTVYPLVYEK